MQIQNIKFPITLFIFITFFSTCKKQNKTNNNQHKVKILKKEKKQKPIVKKEKKHSRIKQISETNKKLKRYPFKILNAESFKLPKPTKQPLDVDYANFTGKNDKRFYYLEIKQIEILSKNAKKILKKYPLPIFKGKFLKYKNPKSKKDEILGIWKKSSYDRCFVLVRYYFEKTFKSQIISSTLCGSYGDSRYIRAIDIKHHKNSIYLAYHDRKYSTKIIKINLTNYKIKEVFQKNMIQAIYPFENGLLVGRIYGDKPGSKGEALLLTKNTRGKFNITKIPSVNGVRSLLAVKQNNKSIFFLGDGWHKNYGKFAKPYISMVYLDKNTYKRKLIDTLQNDFTVLDLKYADIDGNGERDLIAKGNNSLVVYLNSNFKKIKLANLSNYSPIKIINRNKTNKILITLPYPTVISLKKSK